MSEKENGTKIYRCPGCGSNMEYAPAAGMLFCMYCGRQATLEEAYEAEKEQEDSNIALEQQKEEERRRPKIQVQTCRCTACGAELAVNDVEVSTQCPYCGQSGVIMDRVEEYLAPDYIIPFQVTKEEAEASLRNMIANGDFIPQEVKDFKMEYLRGIYVPFWLYDIYYKDKQIWEKGVMDHRDYVYTKIVAEANFSKIMVNASSLLGNTTARRLGSYDMKKLKPFQASYLSGFYADRFDRGMDDADAEALQHAGEYFFFAMYDKVNKGFFKKNNPVAEITGCSYALLPAWFMTFRINNTPYTILVNGQTGKIFGAIPADKKKVRKTLLKSLFLWTCASLTLHVLLTAFIVWTLLSGLMIGNFLIVFGLMLFFLGDMIAAFTLYANKHDYNEYYRNTGLTNSNRNSQFVRERQDRR